MSRRLAGLLLGAILAISLALQVIGMDRMESDPDECRHVESALVLVDGCRPFFGIGYCMTPMWLWSAALNGGSLLGNLGGMLKSVRAGKLDDALWIFERSRLSVYTNPIEVNNRLRWINALAAIGIVLLAYMLAFRLSGSRTAGLAAAAICGISPLVVTWGTNFHPDQFLALCAAASLYFCAGEAEGKGNYQWLAASIFCGAATANKIIAAVFWIPLVLAVFWGSRREPRHSAIRRILAATIAALVSYLVIDPYILVDFVYFMKGIFLVFYYYYGDKLGNVSQTFMIGPKTVPGFVVIILSLIKGMGLVSVIVAIAGMAFATKNRTKGAFVLLAGIIAYVAVLSTTGALVDRYTLALAPLIAAFAGYALVNISRMIPSKWSYPLIGVLILGLGIPTRNTVQIVRARMSGDTRTQARQWIVEHVPPGSTVYVTFYGPILHYDKQAIERLRTFYADRLVNFNTKFTRIELFRNAIRHEEQFQFERFCYLKEVREAPAPAYNLVEMQYVMDDPALLKGVSRYWVVTEINISTLQPGSAGLQQYSFLNRGKVSLAAKFPGNGRMGADLFIYEVNLNSP